MFIQMKKRKYTLKRRAEQQEETRGRIVEAAMCLHQELGPAQTTVKAVAERAGVQRLTVYRHFPDDEELFQACSSHWFSLNPPPSAQAWNDIEDPVARTRAAIGAFNTYYRRAQGMLASVYRDRDAVPAMEPPMAAFDAFLDRIADELTASWKPKQAAKPPLRATLRHCLTFATWQSMDAQGLTDEQMTELGMQWVRGVTL
jgi:AcrR family transcriptional regulator